MLAATTTAVAGVLAVHRVVKSYRDGVAVRRHDVAWGASRPYRVVHLSDLHVGATTPRRVLAEVAAAAHAARPDVVVLTGDYVNASSLYLGRVTELVRSLPKPCIATLGNHDHWVGPDRIALALARGGAKVLRNESALVGDLAVVGVDDGSSGAADLARAFRGVDPDRALVLTHYPNTADEIAALGPRLVLAGHTHGGQVDVPWVTRAVAKMTGNPYLRGFYRVGDRTELYVNAGVGHSLPGFRAGTTSPEVAVFDLRPVSAAG
ncbi:MAG: metallophosphoesterase [Labilithrix sp.]|nr:metallophosphoesterase [Labilithrix sp.]MCW5810296.1 metallophosphoesterase [Labilithrix sp.]